MYTLYMKMSGRSALQLSIFRFTLEMPLHKRGGIKLWRCPSISAAVLNSVGHE